MKTTTLNVSFYCRPCTANKKGLAPIELSLIINGENLHHTAQKKEKPAAFKRSCATVILYNNSAAEEYVVAIEGRSLAGSDGGEGLVEMNVQGAVGQ